MSIGVWQVILILVIVLIIFGAGKLPRVAGDIAKGIKNFKAGIKDEEAGDDKKSLEDETATVAKSSVEKDEPAKN